MLLTVVIWLLFFTLAGVLFGVDCCVLAFMEMHGYKRKWYDSLPFATLFVSWIKENKKINNSPADRVDAD